jgi:hypothetical protein
MAFFGVLLLKKGAKTIPMYIGTVILLKKLELDSTIKDIVSSVIGL